LVIRIIHGALQDKIKSFTCAEAKHLDSGEKTKNTQKIFRDEVGQNVSGNKQVVSLITKKNLQAMLTM